MDWLRPLIRFAVATLVLLFIGYIVPGFSALTVSDIVLTAAAITLIGYLIERSFGHAPSPYVRAIVGFVLTAVIVYGLRYIAPDLAVPLLGALVAALLVGVIDMFVPSTLHHRTREEM